MNSLLLLLIAVPALEIFVFIKVGGIFGALNTILLIITTAVVGIYFAKLEGLNTIKSGIENIYKNKPPIYEILSGASIAFAALLLILPGFITDGIGFLLLIPFTRRLLITYFMRGKKNINNNEDVIEAEVIEDKKDEL
jgi:UPF0716 protein FxsA|tara:strand:- start:188 stop:601 length:414 start_codon:yes stop_codon:yes gene_type:complete